MTTVYLDIELERYTDGLSEVSVEGSTPAEVLLNLFNRFPALYVYLYTPDNIKVLTIVLNDEELLEQDDLNTQLGDSSTLHLSTLLPHGEYGMVFSAVSTFISTAWVAHVVSAIIVIGLAVALNVVMGMLMGDLEMPGVQSGSVGNSYTYTFEGVRNTTAAGTAIPLVYGLHRTGGHILSLYTASDDTDTEAAKDATSIRTDTLLFYQIGLSEGEIASVSNVEINKLPATFYSAVATTPDPNYFKLGEPYQTAMPEFDRSYATTSIGRKISNATPAIPTVPVVYTASSPVYGCLQNIASWNNTPTYTVKRGFYSPSYGMTQQEIDERYYQDLMNSAS